MRRLTWVVALQVVQAATAPRLLAREDMAALPNMEARLLNRAGNTAVLLNTASSRKARVNTEALRNTGSSSSKVDNMGARRHPQDREVGTQVSPSMVVLRLATRIAGVEV